MCVYIKMLPLACMCVYKAVASCSSICLICLFLVRAFFPADYNHYGNERLYIRIDSREFEANIFMGVVFYQRLRHMISDKFQVRTTGLIDILTNQPVKDRKRAGGI